MEVSQKPETSQKLTMATDVHYWVLKNATSMVLYLGIEDKIAAWLK